MNVLERKLCVLPMVLAACAPGDGESERTAAAVRDSAGIRIVENGGDDRPFPAAAMHLSDLVPPDSALTAVPWGIVADAAADRIHVMDRTGARVAMFDGSGAHTGSYGRSGDGPGEFRNPVALAGSGGSVTVWDAGRNVLSEWSMTGVHLGETPAPLSYWGPGFVRSGEALVTVTSTSSGMSMDQQLVLQTETGSTVLHEVRQEMAMMELPCATMPAPKLLAPSVLWTGRGDTIHVLRGPEYRIDVLAGGAPVASFRRAVEPVRVTDEMAVEAVESGPGPYRAFLRGCGVTAAQLAAAVGHEDVVTPVLALATDPAGRVWVSRSRSGMMPAVVDVLDATGAYQGTLELAAIPVAFLSDTLFVGLRVQATGEPVAALYALSNGMEVAGLHVRAAHRSYHRPGPWSDRSNSTGLRVARPMD